MTNAISKKIILMIVMFLVASGGIVYSANFKKEQLPEAPKIEVEATESGELINESTPSASPEIPSVKSRVNVGLKSNPTPKVTPQPQPVAGQIDCDLRPYGGGRTSGTEAQCKEQIRIMLESGNPGVHCSQTAQGCNSMQLDDLKPVDINLDLPQLSQNPPADINLPDYQGAIDGFNESVNMSPLPLPCVPVGDGFNCL